MSHRTRLVFTIFFILLTLTAGAAYAQSGTTEQIGLVVTFPDGSSH